MKEKLIFTILIMAGIIAANVFAQDEVFQIRSEMTNSSEKIVNKPFTIDGIIKWEETFDTILQPTDWQVIDNDGSGTAWDFRQLVAFTSGDTVNPHAGQSFWFSNFGNANPSGLIDEWLITPKLPMIESGDSLHFYAGAIGGSFDDSLRVWVSTSDSLPGSFTDLIGYFKVDGPTGSWTRYSFDLSAYNGAEIFVAANYYIVDGGPAGTHSDNIWIDHFILEGQGQAAADKLLISEFVVTPTEGEFVEIFNPNPSPVVLSDYYLTDATFAGGSTYYYQIVEGGGGGGGFADWHARFPDGATIQAGEYQTISLNGDADFFGEYGVNPTYEMDQAEHASGVPDAIPDMREAVLYSIFGIDSLNNPGLTNGDEVIILYHWDGMSDLVGDLDYVLYNSGSPAANNEAVDKTGVRIDGPDPGTDSTEYLPDTSIPSQMSAINHPNGFSVHRIDFTEGAQVTTGGNGVTGGDETSENLDFTFNGMSIPSPNAPYQSSQALMQVIHNAADPAADTVDVYVDGTLALDDFAFRTATAYLPFNSGVPIDIGVAPGNSTSVSDTLKNFPVTLASGVSYVAVANGVLDPMNFAPNPNSFDIAFTLFVRDSARTVANSSDVEFFAVHGATDAPYVDIIAQGVGTLLDNVPYGGVSDYLAVPPAAYTIDIADSTGGTVVASFDVNLSGLGGGTAAVLASGFLDPSTNQNGAAFALLGVLADGTVINFPPAGGATVEFFDDFESGTSNWTLEGGWGLTDQVSYSPINSLTESPVGNYPPNQDISATMAAGVDLSAALDATLSFWARYNIELGFDYMYVEVSTNGGAWVQIAVFDGEGFNTFQEYSYSLGGFVGNADVKVRFRFFSDGGYEVDGMYIDDFKITSTDVDNTPPLIVHAGPEFYEGTLEDFMVEAEIVDISGLASANALYTVDGGSFNSLSPDSSSGNMYYFTIPMQAAGVNVDYWITATDNASNVDTVGIFKYIAGNHLIYDNAVVDFVYQYFATQMVAVQMSVPAGSQADLASALIRNYTDINRPNDTMLVHIWADAGGLPGADLITPFPLYPEATLTNTSPMTRVDLRPYSAQLSGLTGDFFVGFSVPAGAINGVWLVGTSPSAFNRTYIDVGAGWVAAGQDHHFRAIIGDTSAVGIAGVSDLIPEEFALYQNYPNPFNPTTTIKYALKENADVSIKIYNLLGQEVRTLVNTRQELGYKTVVWNGLNNAGARVASGLYIYRIEAGNFVQARKMILMK